MNNITVSILDLLPVNYTYTGGTTVVLCIILSVIQWKNLACLKRASCSKSIRYYTVPPRYQ